MLLYRIHDDEYLLISNQTHLFRGNRAETALRLMELGSPYTEVEHAISELQLKRDTVAHFGVYGSFLFSARVDN